MPLDAVPLPREDREAALDRVRAHLREETGEEPGDLAVLLLYDFVASEVAPYFFNAGVTVAQQLLLRAADGLDADLEAAKRLPPRRPTDHGGGHRS